MKHLRKVGLLIALLALVAAACGDDDNGGDSGDLETITAGTLTVGSDIPFPPFEDFDADGNVIGFDAELIEEAASRLGLDVEWVDTDFDTIFTQLATGQFDVVASATTITPEREEQVDFSIPYYKAQQALTVNTAESDISSVSDLGDGDRVAVQTGTTGLDWAIENLQPEGVEVVEFPAAPDTYNALEAGQVDAVVFDEPSAVEEASRRPGLEVVDTIDTNENYGFGVDPENNDLLDAFNDALQEMIDDGKYQEIYDKWFGDAAAGSVAQ